MRRHPGGQQLVGAQPQHGEHRGVDLLDRAAGAGGDHRVVGALPAQRPGGELGGQRGVAPGQAPLAQGRRRARGWRRRRPRSPPAARRGPRTGQGRPRAPRRAHRGRRGGAATRRGGAGARRRRPGASGGRPSGAEPGVRVEPHAARPVGGGHLLLAERLELARAGPAWVPVPTCTAFLVTTSAPGPRRDLGVGPDRAELDALAGQRGPGARARACRPGSGGRRPRPARSRRPRPPRR